MNAPPLLAPLLVVDGLSKHFPAGQGLFGGGGGKVHALNAMSITLEAGRTLALVGESGCGKTTAARTIARLYTPDAGRVLFKGTDLAALKGKPLKSARRTMQMVFQDPFGSLNPRLTVATIIREPLVIHNLGDKAERRARVTEAMVQVGLDPRDGDRYPHEFSGGQRQRIAIARALVVEPELIIADEPLSALDVSIQSQILNLMKDLQETRGLAFLFITHDLAVVDYFADDVAVMYLGHVVEIAPREDFFTHPFHPYSRTLMDAVPVPGAGKRKPSTSPPGDVPSPINPPTGCPFHPRCVRALDQCRESMPPLANYDGNRRVACHNPEPKPPSGPVS
jgi:oligopeptide/dipeptide ABC transporter ATP-binding protein